MSHPTSLKCIYVILNYPEILRTSNGAKIKNMCVKNLLYLKQCLKNSFEEGFKKTKTFVFTDKIKHLLYVPEKKLSIFTSRKIFHFSFDEIPF